jgi:hypothetical protein
MEFLSIGTLCHCSYALKHIGFKKRSYPFDWIFSNPKTVLECIENKFKFFLDKTYYISYKPTQCGHSLYHKHMFNHHNPLTNHVHYGYFERCVDRFLSIACSPDVPKCFVITFVNQDSKDTTDWDTWNRSFERALGHNNYTLVVIQHKTGDTRTFDCTKHMNILFFDVQTISRSHGTCFGNPQDNTWYAERLVAHLPKCRP